MLLIGDIGRHPSDPPITVEVTGDLPLEYGANAKGLSAPVIPFLARPTLVLALGYKPGTFPCDTPPGTHQIVVAILPRVHFRLVAVERWIFFGFSN